MLKYDVYIAHGSCSKKKKIQPMVTFEFLDIMFYALESFKSKVVAVFFFAQGISFSECSEIILIFEIKN